MTWFEWINAHSFSFDLFVPLMVFHSPCLHCSLFISIYIPCSIFSTHYSYTSHQQFDIIPLFSFIIDVFILDSFFIIDKFILDVLRSMVYETLCTYSILYTRVWGFIIGYLSLVSFFFSFYHLSLRYILSLKTTLRLWYHTLCLIALMWAILTIGSRTF